MSADRTGPGPQKLKPSLVETLIGYYIRRADSVASADFAQALEGTGTRQVLFAVTAIVAANGGINQGAVGKELGVKRANMVALVNELVDMGVIDRRAAPGDRRAFALHLTPEGRRRFDEWSRLVVAHEEALFKNFSPAERALLIELLARLAKPHS